MTVCSIKGLQKELGDFRLGPVDLTIDPGEVVGFVGPNGAGKTTTMRCMMNIYYPDAGSIQLEGKPVNGKNLDWKYSVGYLGEYNSFFSKWSVEKNMKVVADFYDDFSIDYAFSLAEKFDLAPGKRVKDLSTGNKQKLALILAMARRPRFLLLDEPLASIDPLISAEILDSLREQMVDGNSAVFLSTHVVSTLQDFADRLVFINDGKIMADHYSEDLKQDWRRIRLQADSLPEMLPSIISSKSSGRDHELVSSDSEKSLAALADRGIQPAATVRMGLDEIAVYLLREGRKC
jgi:ABC-2 type transport system ATP-binding protein